MLKRQNQGQGRSSDTRLFNIGEATLKANQTGVSTLNAEELAPIKYRLAKDSHGWTKEFSVCFGLRHDDHWIGWGEWKFRRLQDEYARMSNTATLQAAMVQTFGLFVAQHSEQPCLAVEWSEIFDPKYRGKGYGNLFPAFYEAIASSFGAAAIVSTNLVGKGSSSNRYVRHFSGGKAEDGMQNYVAHLIQHPSARNTNAMWTLIHIRS